MRSVGVVLAMSDTSRLSARRERAANGDRALKVQIWRVLIALKACPS